MKTLLLMLAFIPFTAQALELRGPANPEIHSCTARIVVPGEKIYSEFSFAVGKNGGPHGGQSFEFVEGKHKFDVQADGKWLIMLWKIEQKVVAQSLFLVGPNDTIESRVGIMFNPENTDDQVSVSCSKL